MGVFDINVFNRSVFDGIGYFAVNLEDGLTINESLAAARKLLLSITESLGLLEAASSFAIRKAALQETEFLFESAVPRIKAVLEITDTLSETGGVSFQKRTNVLVAEASLLEESFSAIRKIYSLLYERVDLMESQESEAQGFVGVTVGDSLSLAEYISAVKRVFSGVSEALSVAESVSRTFKINARLGESISFRDKISGYIPGRIADIRGNIVPLTTYVLGEIDIPVLSGRILLETSLGGVISDNAILGQVQENIIGGEILPLTTFLECSL